MGERSVIMKWETFESTKSISMSESPQAFSHENKKEGIERISLSDTLRRIEGSWRDAIDENWEESSGDKAENPMYPGVVKPKS